MDCYGAGKDAIAYMSPLPNALKAMKPSATARGAFFPQHPLVVHSRAMQLAKCEPGTFFEIMNAKLQFNYTRAGAIRVRGRMRLIYVRKPDAIQIAVAGKGSR